MAIILTTLKKILFWSYDRGTWQYDIMCVLILAFVFLAPNTIFKHKDEASGTQNPVQSVFVSKARLGKSDPANLEHDLAKYLSEEFGYSVTVSGIEPLWDDKGMIRGYLTQVSADRATARD